MKKTSIALACLLTALTTYAVTYNPSDVQKYDKTGICPNCDLSDATIFCRSSSDLDSAILNNATFGDVHQCGTSTFKNAFMIGTHMGNNGFPGSDFTSALMRGIQFGINSNLSSAHFNNANLQNANLSTAVLTRTDFSGANISGADLSYTDMTGSNISKQQLAEAKTYCSSIMPNGSQSPKCKF